MARKDAPSECPLCGQPLVDETVVRRLRQREAEMEQRYRAEAATMVEQRLAAERAALEKKIRGEHAQQEKARDRMMAALQHKNEELERRFQKLAANERGDANEIDVFERLQEAFAGDRVERQGRSGDILQFVRYEGGGGPQEAGTIVYECKDTLRWSNDFLAQTKKAGRAHRSPYTVLVTKAFPAGEKDLCVRDGVMIVHPSKAVLLAELMRRAVIEIHRAALKSDARSDKTSRLYAYLTGNEFRSAFDAVSATAADLEKLLRDERLNHERIWTRRAQVYGDLGRRTAGIDEAIRGILEAPGAQDAKVLRFPTAVNRKKMA